jgi:hypothetical protein
VKWFQESNRQIHIDPQSPYTMWIPESDEERDGGILSYTPYSWLEISPSDKLNYYAFMIVVQLHSPSSQSDEPFAVHVRFETLPELKAFFVDSRFNHLFVGHIRTILTSSFLRSLLGWDYFRQQLEVGFFFLFSL